MKITSFAISDLELLFDDEILLLTLTVVLEDYNSLGMCLQILFCRINFGSFLKIILAAFVSAATPSIMVIHILDSPTTLTKLFDYFSLAYWCWYSCRCCLTIIMAAHVHVALALRLKLKLWENFHWYSHVYGLVFIFLKSTWLCHWRKKSLKTFKTFFLLLYFVIVEIGVSLSYTILYGIDW
jgi:hypothetical protein